MIKYSENVKFEDLERALQRKLMLFDRFTDTEIIATSGLRDPAKNAKIGGVEKSSHLKGFALDIYCPNGRIRHEIIFCALAVGFKRIGIGKTHIHLDLDPEKPQPTIFFDNYLP